MISLNLTILVQVINFTVAYFLIVNILLKPAKAYIFDKMKNISDLKTEISHQQHVLKNLQEEKTIKWRDCSNHISSHKPKILDKVLLNNISEELKRSAVDKLSDIQSQTLAEELVNNLKMKL